MFSHHQWLKLSIVLLLALLARVAMGAPAPQRAPSVRESVSSRKALPLDLTFGPGIVVMPDTSGFGGSSSTGLALSLSATTPVARTFPLYVGLETGLDFYSPSQFVSAKSIRLLPTAFYKFSFGKSPVHPYAGLLVGINIAFSSFDNGLGGFGFAPQSDSKVYFELLSRFGCSFDLSNLISLWAEPRFGLVSDQFVFMGLTGITFSL